MTAFNNGSLFCMIELVLKDQTLAGTRKNMREHKHTHRCGPADTSKRSAINKVLNLYTFKVDIEKSSGTAGQEEKKSLQLLHQTVVQLQNYLRFMFLGETAFFCGNVVCTLMIL